MKKTASDCVACGHPVEEHAEFVDNGLGSTKEDVARRQCLHGVTFTKRTDHRGSSFVSSDKRQCDCELYQGKFVKVSKLNGKARR